MSIYYTSCLIHTKEGTVFSGSVSTAENFPFYVLLSLDKRGTLDVSILPKKYSKATVTYILNGVKSAYKKDILLLKEEVVSNSLVLPLTSVLWIRASVGEYELLMIPKTSVERIEHGGRI